jgi:hypothetical protein
MTEPIQTPPAGSGPNWRPPRERDGNVASIVVGLVLLVIGIWYLLDQTLDIDMPRISWGDFWPVILIVIGGVIVFQSARRRA